MLLYSIPAGLQGRQIFPRKIPRKSRAGVLSSFPGCGCSSPDLSPYRSFATKKKLPRQELSRIVSINQQCNIFVLIVRMGDAHQHYPCCIWQRNRAVFAPCKMAVVNSGSLHAKPWQRENIHEAKGPFFLVALVFHPSDSDLGFDDPPGGHVGTAHCPVSQYRPAGNQNQRDLHRCRRPGQPVQGHGRRMDQRGGQAAPFRLNAVQPGF